nr:hypothetical 10.1K protein (INF56 region) - rust fungus (Uromyces appendiculatus) [Uromyces appendiculatus]
MPRTLKANHTRPSDLLAPRYPQVLMDSDPLEALTSPPTNDRVNSLIRTTVTIVDSVPMVARPFPPANTSVKILNPTMSTIIMVEGCIPRMRKRS